MLKANSTIINLKVRETELERALVKHFGEVFGISFSFSGMELSVKSNMRILIWSIKIW